MSLTLIVENNEQLRNIYSLNLKTWVGSDSVGVKYASQFKGIYQLQDEKVDLVIAKSKAGDENCAEVVHNVMQELGLNIPMIIIGESKVPPAENIIHLDTGLEIQPLIKQAAGFLGVTAKDMASLSVGSHFEISIEFFKNLKRSVVDVYSLSDKNYSLLFPAYQDFAPNEISQLISQGTSKLYVKSGDRLKFVSNVTAELVTHIPLNEVSDDDIVKVQEISINLLQEKLARMGINKETVALSKQNMKQMIGNAKRHPKLGNLMNKMLKNKSSYRFKHTQVLTYVCMHIMEHIDWGNEEQKQKIAFVAFFHDIVLENDDQAMIHSEADLKASSLGPAEKDLVSKHAQLSAEIVRKYPSAPMGADIIVRQHHGVNHGVGFSETYGGNLSPMTIVFILAEDFTDGLLRSGAENMDVVGKIAQMRERYPTQRFQKIIDLLDSITV